MKIVIVGTGYVGLVSGACFSAWGHDVTCVDIDEIRIERLGKADVPFFEPGLLPLVQQGLRLNKLRFTSDIHLAMQGADIVMLAVGTPSGSHDGEADLSSVFEAARQIATALKGPAVIVTKSTVPVGTSERLEDLMRALRPARNFDVASNPEFLREGSAITDFLKPDRIVIGCESGQARAALLELYRPLTDAGVPVVSMTRRSAELTKYAANAFLATKIAFVNEIADLCEKVGAEIGEIALGIGLDKRIGADFLRAGPGYGGSCFPKDTTALLRTAQEHGVSLRIVEETIASNTSRKRNLANRLKTLVGGSLHFRRIAVLGLTFKADTDDMRDAPSLTLIHALQCAGASVSAFDPQGMSNARRLLSGVELLEDPYACCEGADAVVLMTDWACLKSLDYARLGSIMRRRNLLDLRGMVAADEVAAKHGFTVDRVGQAVTWPPLEKAITIKARMNRLPNGAQIHNGYRTLAPSRPERGRQSEGKEEGENEQISTI